MAKKKPMAKPKAKPTARPKPRAKKRTHKPKPAPAINAAATLERFGFFRAEFLWEEDRFVPALDARVRLNVDHRDGVVTQVQARAVELLLECETPLRPLAVKAAYELMLKWVEGYRQRHPNFRGKPIGEKPFTKGCELKSVLFPVSFSGGAKPAPVFVLTLFWPEDNRPCEVRFECPKGQWIVTNCERT